MVRPFLFSPRCAPRLALSSVNSEIKSGRDEIRGIAPGEVITGDPREERERATRRGRVGNLEHRIMPKSGGSSVGHGQTRLVQARLLLLLLLHREFGRASPFVYDFARIDEGIRVLGRDGCVGERRTPSRLCFLTRGSF